MKNLKDNIRNIEFSREGLSNFFKENKKLIIKIFILILVVIGLSTSYFINKDEDKQIATTEVIENEEYIEEEVKAKIVVDISGEVENPMVAELPPGSRVDDAIKTAGGLTNDADISNINRASLVEDGQKIVIPSAIKQDGGANNSGASLPAESLSEKKVNINTASSDELRTLNGVGPATAEKIIVHRESNGQFKKIEDIMDVSGIGEKTFAKFKDKICVN